MLSLKTPQYWTDRWQYIMIIRMEHHDSIIITLEILLTQTSTFLQLCMDPDIHDYVHTLRSQVLTEKT